MSGSDTEVLELVPGAGDGDSSDLSLVSRRGKAADAYSLPASSTSPGGAWAGGAPALVALFLVRVLPASSHQ